MIKSSEFKLSIANIKQFNQVVLPCFALTGRSNAGKSTLLNKICQRKSLAKTSGTPGKTQTINLFEVLIDREEENLKVLAADLPGFGYAKFSKKKRITLTQLGLDFIEQVEQLQLVFFLHDIRRELKEEDLNFRDYVYDCGKFFQPVFTKADKLSQSQRAKELKKHAQVLGLEVSDLLSSGLKSGISPLVERIYTLCKH